jgi:superfamily I DNA/RNA helicase
MIDHILNQLNPEQAAAAAAHRGPVLVLAGAGTGKTRVITYRIAGMIASGIAPEEILGLTFTNKAAREMRERLAQLIVPGLARQVTLGTFHAFCVKVLRRDIGKLGYLPNFTIADESDQQGLLKQSAAAVGLHQEKFPLAEAAALIGSWKNKLLTPREARDAAEYDFQLSVGQLYEEYQGMLEMQNMIDFDDMLFLVYRLFTEFPDVLAGYQATYRYLLVDEYQDTNDAQFTLLKLLTGENRNLCVVGDDDQSIYSWRGANISNILDFPEMFPGAKVVKLEQNYRSTEKILAVANAVIAGNGRRHHKALWSKQGAGEPVLVVRTASGEREADFIADYIRQTVDEGSGRRFQDFAVLYRSNHLSRQIEQSLRMAGIPYRLVGGQEFYKRKEIKDAVAYLKLLVNPAENQSLLRILATPPRGLAQKAADLLKAGYRKTHQPMVKLLGDAELLAALGGKGAAAAKELFDAFEAFRAEFAEPGQLAVKVNAFLRRTGYLDGLQKMYKDYDDALKRRENVDEFINAVAQYEQRAAAPPTLGDYLESFALLEENDRTSEDEAGQDAVTLSTVHAAKGLEFPVVFNIALETGLFPHERAVAEGSTEEELRLFYVAVTRARELLLLCRADARMQRGFSRIQNPSPFLRLLPPEAITETTPAELIKVLSKEDAKEAFAKIFKMLERD